MRLQLLSDLHFEFHRDGGRSFVDSLDSSGVDVLVLAGDIAVGAGIGEALGLFCRHYAAATVLYVHGNHEFYKTERAEVLAFTQQAERDHANLVWLDNTSVELMGRRFVGTPLWFAGAPFGPKLKRAMSDFTEIRNFETWVYAENERAVAMLHAELGRDDVVVTHHLPSQRSVSRRFVGHPLNPFFVCDLEALIAERQPRLWVHGHTHDSVHYAIGRTTVLCNPFGYAGYELNAAFSHNLIVDV
jgi:Icc-related predicted phosphoesterase